MALIKLKRYEEAENDCSRALQLNAENVKALSRRGVVRHKRGRYVPSMRGPTLCICV